MAVHSEIMNDFGDIKACGPFRKRDFEASLDDNVYKQQKTTTTNRMNTIDNSRPIASVNRDIIVDRGLTNNDNDTISLPPTANSHHTIHTMATIHHPSMQTTIHHPTMQSTYIQPTNIQSNHKQQQHNLIQPSQHMQNGNAQHPIHQNNFHPNMHHSMNHNLLQSLHNMQPIQHMQQRYPMYNPFIQSFHHMHPTNIHGHQQSSHIPSTIVGLEYSSGIPVGTIGMSGTGHHVIGINHNSLGNQNHGPMRIQNQSLIINPSTAVTQPPSAQNSVPEIDQYCQIVTDSSSSSAVTDSSSSSSSKQVKRKRKGYKCPHNRQKSKCKECKGSGICEHNKVKTYCKECKGSGLCEHKRQKSRCKDCGGSSICEHSMIKIFCKLCKGSQICEHEKVRNRCKECCSKLICSHENVKSECKECKCEPKR